MEEIEQEFVKGSIGPHVLEWRLNSAVGASKF